ncbi:MAG TPA: tyrosine-type recombinase/integrase, partial [Micromonosporaceae bacterium]|nr:tyrosine-type recombinase/integrase [Micromonosporaceae bacterium]
MPLTLNDALADYYEVKRGSYKPTSWRGIQQRLEHWRTWVTRATQPYVYLADVADPGERYMERYFNKLRPPAYKPASFNLFRQHLNGFWAYTRDRGWVHTNPMMHVDPLRNPRKINLMLSAEELINLLESADDPRDRAALALGMNTGLRAGDITTLTVGDVDLTSNRLTAWIEKANEQRTFGITA